MRRCIVQKKLIGLCGFILVVVSQVSVINAQENETFISFAQELQLQDDANGHTLYNNDLRITYNQKLSLDRVNLKHFKIVFISECIACTTRKFH